MALKNQNIASANPASTVNRAFIDALYKEKYGRYATDAEYNKFKSNTVKDASNIILGQELSPFTNTKLGQPVTAPATINPATAPASALKNQTIAAANPASTANRAYIDALYKEKYGRYATDAEYNRFKNSSAKDAANIILGQALSPFTNEKITQQATAQTDNQAAVDKQYAEAAAANPAIATLAKGGSTLEEIINGLSTGDLSGLVDWEGKPFSVEDQQAALAQAMEDNRLYYEAMQAKDQADAESAMAKKQADYQDYLIQSGQQFQADKDTADQNAADQGVLFSGSRVQKEKNLARAYAQDQATNQRNFATSIGDTARDFQYKYGNAAATGLNKYYNLGSNTYDASKAQGGVASGGLSTIYNPSDYNFQGTKNTERQANANTRAAGYLWNKSNKLLATGSNNKY